MQAFSYNSSQMFFEDKICFIRCLFLNFFLFCSKKQIKQLKIAYYSKYPKDTRLALKEQATFNIKRGDY